jgi:hypothetical protein
MTLDATDDPSDRPMASARWPRDENERRTAASRAEQRPTEVVSRHGVSTRLSGRTPADGFDLAGVDVDEDIQISPDPIGVGPHHVLTEPMGDFNGFTPRHPLTLHLSTGQLDCLFWRNPRGRYPQDSPKRGNHPPLPLAYLYPRYPPSPTTPRPPASSAKPPIDTYPSLSGKVRP